MVRAVQAMRKEEAKELREELKKELRRKDSAGIFNNIWNYAGENIIKPSVEFLNGILDPYI